jgi:hypothetical protein
MLNANHFLLIVSVLLINSTIQKLLQKTKCYFK